MKFTPKDDKSLTNQAFLRAVFAELDPATEVAWAADFTTDPDLVDRRLWKGKAWRRAGDAPESADSNNYFSTASLVSSAQGRRKEYFNRLFCIVLDDPETVPDTIEPTWVIQTSRHSRQVGYKLAQPLADKARAEWFVNLLAHAKLVPVDKSGNSICRFVRLPVGSNTKVKKYGEVFPHQLLHWNPDATHTLEDLYDALKLQVPEASASAPPSDKSTTIARKPASEYLELVDAIRTGETFHTAAYRLACHRICNGMSERATLEELQALFHESEAPRDDRWQTRFRDLPRLVRDAAKLRDKNPRLDAVALFDALQAPGAGDVATGWHIEPFGQDAKPDLSHDALALRLGAAGFAKDARYLPERGRWMFWTGTHWDSNRELHVFTAVRDFLRAQANQLTDWAETAATAKPADADSIRGWAASQSKQLRQAPTVSAVETLARSNAGAAVTIAQCDADPELLGTPAGTVDLTTGQLRDAKRDDLITKQTSVAPAPEGETSPLWNEFLHTVMQGDTELVRFLQTLAGYAATGLTREQRLFFLFGTGSNGKSVFLNTLMSVFGDYARKAPADTFLQTSGERHPTDLAGLRGARLVVSSELDAGRAWNESTVKDLTGSDVLTARFMRGDYFDYLPQFTLLLAGNHLPQIRSVGEAMARRIVLIPFDAHIPVHERDEKLPQKLQAQAPLILRWVIDGAVRYFCEGLVVPESVQARSSEYLATEDSLGQFLQDETVASEQGAVGSTTLYSTFRLWAERNGVGHRSQRAFTQMLMERGVRHQRRKDGRVFTGLMLKANLPATDGSGVVGGLAQ